MHENVIFYTFPTPFRVIIKGNLLKISLIPKYKDSRSGYEKRAAFHQERSSFLYAIV